MSAHSYCRRLVSSHKIDFIMLLETQLSGESLKRVEQKYQREWKVASVSSIGRSGGIILMWRENKVEVEMVMLFQQAIVVKVTINREKTCIIGGIYSSVNVEQRRLLWGKLSQWSRLGYPVVFAGDFNTLLHASEKSGSPFREDRGVIDFRECLMESGLVDLGFNGPKYTWKWSSAGGRRSIFERLDRALGSHDWMEMFPGYVVTHLARIASDHRPLLIDTIGREFDGPKPFRFETFWMELDGCREVVEKQWDSVESGSPTRQLWLKCSAVKTGLRKWNKDNAGNIFEKAKKLEEEIRRLQMVEESTNLSVEEDLELKQLTSELHNNYRCQELFWKQRSRVCWLKQGDQNTSFFHRSTVTRRARNLIHRFELEDGSVCEGRESITKGFEDYFRSKWGCSTSDSGNMDLDCLPCVVDEELNALLCRPFEVDEVENVIRGLPKNKAAAGPDGLNAEFYKRYWDLVRDDVLRAVAHFHATGALPVQWKSAFISLIPKKENPKSPRDFRPISLCNLSYKIISKLLVNRLKPLLNRIISDEQSAFISGRIITDNILLVQELVHSMKYKRAEGELMGVKLDMERAYDLMSWDYIEAVLRKFGFDSKFVQMIMGCVRGASFAVMVNGSASGWFRSTKGLRQGDPLSPYLFIIGSELLLRKLRQARETGQLSGMRISQEGHQVGACIYADDSILIAKAARSEAGKMSSIIKEYCETSGQSVNFEKSSLFFGAKVSRRVKRSCSRSLGIREGSVPFKYLGVMIGSSRLPFAAFNPLLDRIRGKMNSWKAKALSFAGRVVLIKSVLQSMPIHILSASWVPKAVINKLELFFRQFLWGKDGGQRSLALVGWEVVCSPKREGGLGVRDIRCTREALMGKQMARVVGGANNPAARLIKWKYGVEDVWNIRLRSNMSPGWRAISQGLNVVRQGLRWAVGNGHSINMHYDPWLGEIPLNRMATFVDVGAEISNVCVGDLIVGREWDVPKLRAMFHECIVKRILEIPIPVHSMEDMLLWMGKSLTDFSTCHAYQQLCNRSSFDRGLGKSWMWIWRLGTSERVKMWVWKVGVQCVPTKAFLGRRGLINGLRCVRCEEYAEDLHHLLLECAVSVDVWGSVISRFELQPLPNNLQSWWNWFSEGGGCSGGEVERTKKRSLLAYITWEIWKGRNTTTFQHEQVGHASVVDKAVRQWCEWWEWSGNLAEGTRSSHNLNSRVVKWQMPFEGWIKVNFDGSMDAYGEAAASYVIRDDHGKMLGAGGKFFSGMGDINGVELRGAWEAIKAASRRFVNTQGIWVEGDSIQVINMFGEDAMDGSNLIKDAKLLLQSFTRVKISHVLREGNQPADWVANYCRAEKCDVEWGTVGPPQLESLVAADAYGVVYVRE